MEHQCVSGGGGIDLLLQADQIDFSGFDVRARTIRLSCPFTSPLGLDHIIPSRKSDWHSGTAGREIARPLHIKTARESEMLVTLLNVLLQRSSANKPFDGALFSQMNRSKKNRFF